MKIEYIRQLQNSYMRIELTEPLGQTEKEMLIHNKVEGLLPISWQQEDDRMLLRYDITGKQALDELLEEKKADEKLLLLLLSSVCRTVEELEKYLLPQHGLLLQPEGIFYDYKTDEIFFCFYPEEKNMQEQLLRLMEVLLTKTNHKDKEAVELVYGIYEEVRNPAYSIREIKEYMRLHRSRHLEQGEKVQEVLQDNVEAVQEEKASKWHFYEKIDTWKENLLYKMTAWVHPLQERLLRRKKTEQFVFEPEEEEVKQGLPTELLAVSNSNVQGILRYEGTKDLPDLIITKLPFLIGSAEDCDGSLKAAGISRKHARITLIEDTYFIEDLNSTNGTKVDGALLSYKTKASLAKNAQVQFANQPFRFQ